MSNTDYTTLPEYGEIFAKLNDREFDTTDYVWDGENEVPTQYFEPSYFLTWLFENYKIEKIK